jgi:hypothetical protein
VCLDILVHSVQYDFCDELVLPKKLVAPSEIIEYLKQEQTVQTILAHPQSENSDETVHEEKNHTEHCEPELPPLP